MHYDSDNKKGCDEYDEDSWPDYIASDEQAPFLLASRGDCTFVEKVENMQNSGAAVAIIVDTNFGESINDIVMGSLGNGGGVRIPSMLIDLVDGYKLVDWYERASDDERKQMEITCEFVLPA